LYTIRAFIDVGKMVSSIHEEAAAVEGSGKCNLLQNLGTSEGRGALADELLKAGDMEVSIVFAF
jgi:hypothetical protein